MKRFLKTNTRFNLSLLAVLAFAVGISTAYAQPAPEEEVDTPSQSTAVKKESAITADTYRQLNLFGDVFERVREQYVEEVEDEKLIQSAINGMLTSLDPHSSFLDISDFEDMRVQTKGEFGGLGIEVTMENGLVKVVSPIDETPAAEAGIEAGDLVVRLNDEEVMGLTLSEAVDKMRGPVGEPITLTVVREGESEPLEITIIRDIIKIRSVRSRVIGEDVGYIRITTFNEQVQAKLEDMIKEIKEEAGENLLGYIIDLRNNPGGLLDQAIYVADAFLEKGEIVSTRGRYEEDTEREMATEGDMADGLPIVVLVNGGSASASEIVAGALQDHHRGIVMGTQTFGKGSVQTIISLGGEGAMRLTTARYYTPSGRSIQAKGIEPDITVKLAKIETIKRNYQPPKEADLHGALTNDTDKDKKKDALDSIKSDKDENESEDEMDDYQLARALDLIRGIAHFQTSHVLPTDLTLPVDDKKEKSKEKNGNEDTDD